MATMEIEDEHHAIGVADAWVNGSDVDDATLAMCVYPLSNSDVLHARQLLDLILKHFEEVNAQ